MTTLSSAKTKTKTATTLIMQSIERAPRSHEKYNRSLEQKLQSVIKKDQNERAAFDTDKNGQSWDVPL